MKEFLFQVARHPQKFEGHIAKRRKQSQQSNEESDESEEREARHSHDLCEGHVLHEKCAKVRQVSLSESDETFYIKDEGQKDQKDPKDQKDDVLQISQMWQDEQGLKLEMCGKREIVSL